MIVGDSTWLKYIIGITFLAYTLFHHVWDSWDACYGAWLIHWLMINSWYAFLDTWFVTLLWCLVDTLINAWWLKYISWHIVCGTWFMVENYHEWYDTCLRHTLYGWFGIWIWYMLDGWLSEKHSYVWYITNMVLIVYIFELPVLGWGISMFYSDVYMRGMHRLL
jgi:hypothetical protein